MSDEKPPLANPSNLIDSSLSRLPNQNFSNLRNWADLKGDLFGPTPGPTDEIALLAPVRHLLARILGLPIIGPDSFFERDESCRLAPSLISRSDAVLFGVSDPRFSLRVYPDTNNHSFLNLRRIYRLWKNIPDWSNKVSQDEIGLNADSWKSLQLIGDCFLETPQRFRKSYHVIAARLAAAYGESDDKNVGYLGTPFVSYTELAGSCGPASIFIASTLRPDAQAIHGLAEISGNIPISSGTIDVGNMTTDEVSNYLERIGLRGGLQFIPGAHFDVGSGIDSLAESAIYEYALKSYLESDIPVIVMVDLNRLNGVAYSGVAPDPGESIHKINGTGFDPAIGTDEREYGLGMFQPMRHFVVLIGSAKDRNCPWFLMHDPVSFPYLQISADKLIASSPYYRDETLCRLSPPSLIPVTSKDVTMPLLSEAGITEDQIGLFETAARIQIGPLAPAFHAISQISLISKTDFPGVFELVSSDSEPNNFGKSRAVSSWLKAVLNAGLDFPAEFRGIVMHYLSIKVGSSSHLWIQATGTHLWIWKAQSDPDAVNVEELNSLRKNLIAVLGPKISNPRQFTLWINSH